MYKLDVAALVFPLVYPGLSAYPRPNSAKVCEDACGIAVTRPAFVVTDGVTRSVEIGNGDLSMALGAWFAAEAFVEAAINSLQMPVPANETLLEKAFAAGNECVQEMNQAFGLTPKTTDWFKRDLLGVCAAIGIIDDSGTLWYGWIGDCAIAVFNENDMPRLITGEDVSTLEQYRGGLSLSKEEQMILWRRELRNHSNGPHLSYGVATGEKAAESMFQKGRIDLREGDLVLFYTDGAKPATVGDQRFRNTLRAPMPWEPIPLYPAEYHSDATVIVIQVASRVKDGRAICIKTEGPLFMLLIFAEIKRAPCGAWRTRGQRTNLLAKADQASDCGICTTMAWNTAD